MAQVNATATEYLTTLGAVLDSKQHQAIMQRVVRNLEWMQAQHASSDRRSESALHPDRAERERIKKAMAQANARDIYIALLRALRELSDGPLELRIGVIEREKQADSTEQLWLSLDMPLQRGGHRHRGTRLFFISSKVMMSNVIVPGPTAVIWTHSRPDKAVLQVLADIREADPQARIIGVDLDDFDHQVGELLARRRLPDPGDHSVPFTLRLPGLLQYAGAPLGPLAMIVPVSPDTHGIEVVGHGAHDLRGLRAGRNGEWLFERKTIVEDGDEHGALVTRPVIASVTAPVRVCLERGKLSSGFPARIVRIKHDVQADLFGPMQPLLVCVLGVDDPELAIALAIATVSATDAHPRIAKYLNAREAARVFAGEARTLKVLDKDRATASIGFAAFQLDHPEVRDKPKPGT